MRVAGLLLTGGGSRRLGTAKATLLKDGERLVDRGVRVLRTVCEPVVEIGPGYGPVRALSEDPPGDGPLAALAAAGDVLRAEGHHGTAVVLAVDLPFVEQPLVEWLAAYPAGGSVVPRVNGIAQPLCARYDGDALRAAARNVALGERAMRALLADVRITYVDEDKWHEVADARSFTDVDTADAVARAGLQVPG